MDCLLSAAGPAAEPRVHGEPLPIVVTPDNKWRWNEYHAMKEHLIYKFPSDCRMKRPLRDALEQGYATPTLGWLHPHDWPEIDLWHSIADLEEELRQRERTSVPSRRFSELEQRLKRTKCALAASIAPTSPFYSHRAVEALIVALQPDPKKRGRPPYFFDPD